MLNYVTMDSDILSTQPFWQKTKNKNDFSKLILKLIVEVRADYYFSSLFMTQRRKQYRLLELVHM